MCVKYEDPAKTLWQKEHRPVYPLGQGLSLFQNTRSLSKPIKKPAELVSPWQASPEPAAGTSLAAASGGALPGRDLFFGRKDVVAGPIQADDFQENREAHELGKKFTLWFGIRRVDCNCRSWLGSRMFEEGVLHLKEFVLFTRVAPFLSSL